LSLDKEAETRGDENSSRVLLCCDTVQRCGIGPCRLHFILIRWYPITSLHGVTSHKTTTWQLIHLFG